MYKTMLLPLCLMTLTLTMTEGTPVRSQVQKRFFVEDAKDTIKALGGQIDKAVDGVTDWWTDTESDEDNFGQEMMDRGKHLLQLAASLSQKAYDEVTDPQNRQKIKDAIDTVSKAANDVINAGKKVIDNRGKIAAAVQQAYKDLGSVAKDSIKPLQDSLRLTKESILKAGPALAAAGISAKDSAVALAGALKEMVETSYLITEVNLRLGAIGSNLWNVGKDVVNTGKEIGKSIGTGAKKVAKASGIWNQQNQN